MELDIKEIYSYMHCPLKYKFEYVDGMQADVVDTIKYKQCLHKTMYYFYFSLMNGTVPSMKQMKDKWARIWAEAFELEGNLNHIILKDSQSSARKGKVMVGNKLNIQGFETIHNFYHLNKEKYGTPIAVNHDYRISIADVNITGKFELIRESLDKTKSNRFIDIVDFKSNAEPYDYFLVENDLSLSLSSYAFRELFQAKEDRLIFHHLKSGKESQTTRGEKDFRRMKKTIEGVATCIDKKIFYPRQAHTCKVCPFKNICDKTTLV